MNALKACTDEDCTVVQGTSQSKEDKLLYIASTELLP